jgi:hypothetical protein
LARDPDYQEKVWKPLLVEGRKTVRRCRRVHTSKALLA